MVNNKILVSIQKTLVLNKQFHYLKTVYLKKIELVIFLQNVRVESLHMEISFLK